jgi:hypothetical protein
MTVRRSPIIDFVQAAGFTVLLLGLFGAKGAEDAWLELPDSVENSWRFQL